MRILFIAALFLGLGVQRSLAVSSSPAPAAAPGSPTAAVPPASPESALKQEMSLDAVRKIMGQPDEIKPMKVPNGKAEVWIYKRQVNERSERVQVGTTPIMISVAEGNGVIRQYNAGEKAIYNDIRYVTEETIQLLMFNDHYVTQKISRQEVKHLD